ncbi:MAG: hypothetical protein KBA18_12300, partial [Kiritimatiellae bacterium]|nr:hypothetical protein [Kiritimatiellia bacterium]
WCSAAWFERAATAAQVQTIYGMKIDSVQVVDDFDVGCGSKLPLSKAAASRRTPNEAGPGKGKEIADG